MKNLTYLLVFLCFSFIVNAQRAGIKSADNNYDSFAYADAIKEYGKLVENGCTDEKVIQKLANSYYYIGNLKLALKYYEQLFSINNNQDADYLYKYAQSLKSTGNYTRANAIMEKLSQKAPFDKRGILFLKNKEYIENIKINSGRFEIADTGINSTDSEYGSTVSGNNLIFTSSRDTGSIVKKNFKWTNKAISTLYTVELMQDGSTGKPVYFHKKNLKANLNQSTPVFTKDGKTMYFTRNNSVDGKRKKNENKITFLKLYKANFSNGEWKNVQELPFNNDNYSIAHPGLSVDEKTLYFASDMPGTFGLSDLYKVAIMPDGTYGKPENLGNQINTEGRETFPFISGENELYFASDGHPGLGGLDVYISKIMQDGSFEEVQNIGEPINSRQDDFAFTINSKNRNGFFSSNREGGQGLDDIYRFTEIRKLICEQELSGKITDSETNEELSGVNLFLFDENQKTFFETVSDQKGNYIFRNVNCGKKYTVRTSLSAYDIKEVAVTIEKFSEKTTLPISLEKKLQPITAKTIGVKSIKINAVTIKTIAVGADLAKLLNIPMNFFDLGKATIRKLSEPQLQKVVDILKKYPNIILDIRSHTDSRQSAANNMILSEKRAQSTKNWLIQKGIEPERLTAKGYGETMLVNKCADGIKCTEKQHQQNRRSEFIITNL